MRLSTPSTISIAVSVASAAQDAGSKTRSINIVKKNHTFSSRGRDDEQFRQADEKLTASILILGIPICHPRECGYPGATIRRRKSGPIIGAERLKLRERRGLLD